MIAKLKVRVEGDINEIVGDKQHRRNRILKQLQSLFEKDIKKKIERSFKKVQQDFESDPFMLKEKTKSYYPEF